MALRYVIDDIDLSMRAVDDGPSFDPDEGWMEIIGELPKMWSSRRRILSKPQRTYRDKIVERELPKPEPVDEVRARFAALDFSSEDT